MLVPKRGLSDVVVHVEGIVDEDLRVKRRIELERTFNLHRWVGAQSSVGLAGGRAGNRELFHVKLSVVLQKLKQYVTNIDLAQVTRHLLRLQK